MLDHINMQVIELVGFLFKSEVLCMSVKLLCSPMQSGVYAQPLGTQLKSFMLKKASDVAMLSLLLSLSLFRSLAQIRY